MEYRVRIIAEACLWLFGGYAVFYLGCHVITIAAAMIGGAA